MKDLYIIGAGGFTIEVLFLIDRFYKNVWENIYIISYLYSHPACGYSYTKHAHIAILTYYYKMAIVARACSMPFGTRVNKRQGIHFWHRFSTGIPASSYIIQKCLS